MEIVKVVFRAIGELVYQVAYIPLWLAWNLAGKHIWRAFTIIFLQADREDAREAAANMSFFGDRDLCRGFIAAAYLKYCQEAYSATH